MSQLTRSVPSTRAARSPAARAGAWVLLAVTLGVVLAVARPPPAAGPAPPVPAPSTSPSAPAVSPDELERRLDTLEAELGR